MQLRSLKLPQQSIRTEDVTTSLVLQFEVIRTMWMNQKQPHAIVETQDFLQAPNHGGLLLLFPDWVKNTPTHWLRLEIIISYVSVTW